jgi:hypothetical protein
MIRVGDLVIKNTGGNKMKVISIEDNKAECAWITESFNQGLFQIDELIPLSDYQKLFNDLKRDEKISIILSQI